jgi:hypothetical protein
MVKAHMRGRYGSKVHMEIHLGYGLGKGIPNLLEVAYGQLLSSSL